MSGGFVDQGPARGSEKPPRVIRVNESTGITAYINADVNGVVCKLLVDSGAAVTIISRKLYDRMPVDSRPNLDPLSEHIQLQAADEGLLTVHGIIQVSVNIEEDQFTWNAYVVDVYDDGLLGFDFLHHFDCVLEARHGLRINDRLYPIELTNDNGNRAVYVKYAVTIPPKSEFIVPGVIDELDRVQMTLAIVEPIPKASDRHNIHVATCLVDVTRDDIDIPIRVANLTDVEIRLHEGSRIATLGTIDELYELHDDKDTTQGCANIGICNVKSSTALRNEPPMSGWSDDLLSLYDRSCEHVALHDKDKLFNLFEKYKSIFASSPTDLGRTSIVQHSIDTGDAVPIKQRPRRPPRAFMEEEDKIIETQLKAGIIQESTSAWSSPLVYVKKRDGTTRPCVDYRKLNEVTRKDAYPLPRIEDCLDCLGGTKIFSTLDLQSGYWQVELKEEDRPKTAFSTRSGHYEYVTMPFGLCNAPSTFERAMELVMKGLQWRTLILYLDDIIVMSSTFEEHIQRLDEVLCRLGNAGLKLKPSKCHMFQSEVAYLGHIVSEVGIKPDPEKVDRLRTWPTPASVSDVRSFLGLCSYYRRFIRGFATIAALFEQVAGKIKQIRMG